MDKRFFIVSLLVTLTVAGLIAATFYFYVAGMQKPVANTVTDITPPAVPTKVASEELGGLFMVGHWAHTPVASTTALIKEHHFGGVIIMSAPEDPLKIAQWVKEWNAVSAKPLIIAIDQEGGPVSRLKGPSFTATGQRDIFNSEDAYAVGLARGGELAALGITMNFAPVLDTAKNPDSFMYSRVFKDSEQAAVLAQMMTQGMSDAGVVAVAKHFPGHDDTSDDSHLTLPSVSITKEELSEFTSTFIEYLESKPEALMTAHVLFPKIDRLPATLSSFFLTDYLRKEINFKGVIVTDDMSMNAIDDTWSTSEATLLSLKAGSDLILFAAEPLLAVNALERLKTAVANGEFDVEDVKEKSKRIDSLRPAQN